MERNDWEGFTILEDGSLQLKGFSIRLDFKNSLRTSILKDAVAGLDSVLDSATELFSLALGDDFKAKYSCVEQVQSGSCTFKDISVVLEKGKTLLEEVHHMDSKKLLIICVSCIAWYTLHGVFGYCEKHNMVEGSRKEVTVSVQNSVVLVGNDLRRCFPDDKEEVERVLNCLPQLLENKPEVLNNAASGLIKLAHPGGVDAEGIHAGSCDESGRKQEYQLLNHWDIKQIPQIEPNQNILENLQKMFTFSEMAKRKFDSEVVELIEEIGRQKIHSRNSIATNALSEDETRVSGNAAVYALQ